MYHLHCRSGSRCPPRRWSRGVRGAVGAPLLRLRGHYFAVATLGVAEGLREIVINLPRPHRRGRRHQHPSVGDRAPTRWLGNDGFYILFLVLAVVAVGVHCGAPTRAAGYALRAIHQDEDAAAAMGVRTTLAKTLAFAVSAALTGGIGAAYAFQQGDLPEPAVRRRHHGAAGGDGGVRWVRHRARPGGRRIVIALGSEWLRQNYTQVHTFLLGGLIMVAVILLPQGVGTYLRDAIRTRRVLPARQRAQVPAVTPVLQARGLTRGSAGCSPWTGSTWICGRAGCSASSDRTDRASPPPSTCSPATSGRPPGGHSGRPGPDRRQAVARSPTPAWPGRSRSSNRSAA